MPKLIISLPTTCAVNYTLDKKGKPLISLGDFCQVIHYLPGDAFDFFDTLKEKMGSYWPDIGNYTKQGGGWYITVSQAYALLSECSDLNRIATAKNLLEQTIPGIINQNKPSRKGYVCSWFH